MLLAIAVALAVGPLSGHADAPRQPPIVDTVQPTEAALAEAEQVHGYLHPTSMALRATLVGLYRLTGRYDDAVDLLRREIALLEAEEGPEAPRLAASLNRLAGIHRRQGRTAEADALLQRAIAVYRGGTVVAAAPDDPAKSPVPHAQVPSAVPSAVPSPGPTTPGADPFVVRPAQQAGATAEPIVEPSPSPAAVAPGPGPAPLPNGLPPSPSLSPSDAVVERAATPAVPASPPQRQASPAQRQAYLAQADALDAEADVYWWRGQVAAVEGRHRAALQLREAALGRDDPAVADSAVRLARFLVATGRAGEGMTLFERAIAIKQRHLGPGDIELAEARWELAGLYVAGGNYAAAAPLMAAALDAWRSSRELHPNRMAERESAYLSLLQQLGRAGPAQSAGR